MSWWHTGQQRLSTAFLHGARHGAFRLRDETGRAQVTGHYRHGERHGGWMEWHANGKQRVHGQYANGVRTGLWAWWNDAGQPVADVVPQGVPDGWWTAGCPTGLRTVGGPPPDDEAMGCQLTSGVWHGPYATWHAATTGQPARLKSLGHYRGGDKHGQWLHWSVDGRPSVRASWRDGQPHGLWIWWSQTGEELLRVERVASAASAPPKPDWWRAHKRRCGVGRSLHTEGSERSGRAQCRWPDKTPHGPSAVWADGRLIELGAYVDGKRHGWWRFFHGDGNRMRAETYYRRGREDGRARVWAPNGTLRERRWSWRGHWLRRVQYWDTGRLSSSTSYVGSRRHGIHKRWYPSGRRHLLVGLHHGERHGRSVEWYLSGKKKGEWAWAEGQPIGVWREWDRAGVLQRVDTGTVVPDDMDIAWPADEQITDQAGTTSDQRVIVFQQRWIAAWIGLVSQLESADSCDTRMSRLEAWLNMMAAKAALFRERRSYSRTQLRAALAQAGLQAKQSKVSLALIHTFQLCSGHVRMQRLRERYYRLLSK